MNGLFVICETFRRCILFFTSEIILQLFCTQLRVSRFGNNFPLFKIHAFRMLFSHLIVNITTIVDTCKEELQINGIITWETK